MAGQGAEEEGQADVEEQEWPQGLSGGLWLVHSGKEFQLVLSFKFVFFLIVNPICKLQ